MRGPWGKALKASSATPAGAPASAASASTWDMRSVWSRSSSTVTWRTVAQSASAMCGEDVIVQSFAGSLFASLLLGLRWGTDLGTGNSPRRLLVASSGRLVGRLLARQGCEPLEAAMDLGVADS